ncbi:hypothetical protein LZ183_14415 (plasmid) [Staphylococcus aureus]|uniref:CD3337/EF1877 family mobilome membrane protein n=2 Tax=Staphylococcus TaxID=1279 RepID=UPI00194DD918|nr:MULTISPECIES: hypothetical protein [Staphylococcus]MCQ9841465.1 hypothetical protein [Staphylococcus aureus]WEH49726.1 hypothetical protein LZ183_14415 [Staphylococcus aureus]
MNKAIKLILVVALLFVCSVNNNNKALAVDDEKPNNNGLKVEKQKMGVYKDENPNYAVETLNYKDIKDIEEKKKEKEKEAKEKGIKDKIAGAVGSAINFVPNTLGDVKDDTGNAIKDQGLFVMSKVSNGLMSWTVFMTDLTLNFFHFANDAEILNWLIDGVEGNIQDVAGIDNSGINGTGLFGQFIGLITVFVLFSVIYTAFLKRQPVEALKGLLTPIICMTLAMLLISNMGTYLKGVNNITNTAMNEIVTFGAGVQGDSDIETTEDVLHKAMVYSPYVNMMFGTDDNSVVSQDRVKSLMTENDKEKRKKLLKEEYKNGNDMVHPDSVATQILYGFISVICGSILGVAVLIISMFFLILQIILILWAFVAPFALMWACLPGQFLVAQKFIQKLLTPFVYKLGLSLLIMVLGVIIGLISQIEVMDGIVGYGLQMVLIFAVFITLFLIRNKVMSIFVVTKEGRLLNNLIQSNNFVPQAFGGVASKMPGASMVAGTAGAIGASQLGNYLSKADDNTMSEYGSNGSGGEARPQMYHINDFTDSNNDNDSSLNAGSDSRNPQSLTAVAGSNTSNDGGNDFDDKEDSSNDQLESMNNYTGRENDNTGDSVNDYDDNQIESNDSQMHSIGDYTDKGSDDVESISSNNKGKMEKLSNYADNNRDAEGLASSESLGASSESAGMAKLADYVSNDSGDTENMSLKDKKDKIGNDISNAMIKETTGIDGQTLKNIEGKTNGVMANDPIRKSARKYAGTNWEDRDENGIEIDEDSEKMSDDSKTIERSRDHEYNSDDNNSQSESKDEE